MTYHSHQDKPATLPIEGPGCQVFRRADRIEDALNGRGDIDLLVATEEVDNLRHELRAARFLRTTYRRFHDNISPGREDWLFADPAAEGPVHVDLHTEIRVGPRFAKVLHLKLAEIAPSTCRDTSRGRVQVSDPMLTTTIKIAKASFDLSSVLFRRERFIRLEKPVAATKLDIAGVKLPVRPVDGGIKIAGSDLTTARRAIQAQNGRSGFSVLSLWVRHVCHLAGYAASRVLDEIGVSTFPKRRLNAGGLSIVLLGPDGMGKSTQVELSRDYFSKKFDTRGFYLGHSGMIADIIQSFRPESPQRQTPSRDGKTGAKKHVEDFIRAVWGIWLGWSRLRKVRRARKLAHRGYLVFCDRWPQNLERGYMDGTVRRKTETTWRITEILFSLEKRLYRAIGAIKPDVSFHLVAPYEVSEKRKPGDIEQEAFDQRLALLANIREDQPDIHVIDASQDLESVRRSLLTLIWDRLVQDNADEGERPRSEASEAVWSKVSFSIGGQIVYSLGQLAVLVAIANLHGAEAVGKFGMALAIVTPSFIFANLGLRAVQSIDQAGEFSLTEHSGFRLITISVALLFCSLAAYAIADDVSVLLIILLYALAKSFESISELSYGHFEKHERFELVFRSSVARSLLTATVFVGLLLGGAPLWAAFAAQLVVWAMIALILDLPTALGIADIKRFRPRISPSRFRQLLRRSAPFGGKGFLVGLQPSILRIFVEAQLGFAALGIFTNIFFIFQAGANLGNAVRHFLNPRFSRHRLGKDVQKTWRVIMLINGAIVIACVIGLAVVFQFAEQLLGILFGQETSEHSELLQVVSIALAARLLSTVPASLLYSYGKVVGQFWRELALVVIILVLAPLMIPENGLIGAGWLLVIVSTLRLLADSARAIWVLLLRPEKPGNQSG